MKKIIIWLLAIGGGLILLLIAAIIVIPLFIDLDSYKPEIEKKVTEATGRPFTLGGDLDVSVFPWVGVSFSDLRLGNPEGFESSDFVKVKSFEARMKLLPLLTKKIEIKKFVVDGVEINLEKTADGKMNWATAAKGAMDTSLPVEENKTEEKITGSTTPQIGISSLNIGEFAFINGRVSFVDKSLEQKKEISDISLTLQDVSLDTPISILFKAKLDGKPVALDGKIGPLGKDIGKESISLVLDIDIMEQLKITLTGKVAGLLDKQQFDMALKIEPFSPRKLVESFGVPFPVETSDPAALNKVAVDLFVEGNPSTLIVKNSSVMLDDSQIKIDAALKDLEKPDVTFQFDLDALNLDRYLPPASEKNQKEESGDIVSTETASASEKTVIDYTPLRKLVLNGEIKAGELIAHGAKVNNLILNVKGNEGVFELEPFSLDLYQGSLTLIGRLNVQNEKPVGQVDIQAKNIEVGPLLQDSMKKDILEGTLQAQAAIYFIGDNADGIKQNLNGEGQLRFLDGAIVGLDIAEMSRSLKAGLGIEKPKTKPRTDFAELDVPFTLTDGLFQTPGGKLLSPLLRVSMTGTANLVTEKLNFKVRPKIVGTLQGQGDTEQRSGLLVPLLVEGSFAKPEYSIDLSGLASEQTLKDAVKDPKGTAKKAKSLEKSGKKLLKSITF